MKLIRLIAVLLISSIATYASTKEVAPDYPNKVKIAAIDWCPQICPDSSTNPGYIIEIITEIFKGSPTELIIDYFPWSRAINSVRDGHYLALLSPAKSEAPSLIFPDVPVGMQRMCFYTLENSDWFYTGLESLKGVSIGLAKDTSIEELNEYLQAYPEQFQIQPYHERYIVQNVRKLAKKRMDTFLFTQNSTHYVLENESSLPAIREAGCVSSAYVYFALTPQFERSEETRDLKLFFESGLKKLSESGELDEILKKYNIKFKANELFQQNRY